MSEDSTTRVLRQVQVASEQLLRSCSKLADSLPAAPAAGGAGGGDGGGEWPQLLGHFKSVSAQLGELGGRANLQQLEHVVPVPTNPAALPDGRPTLRIPQLLQTKLAPEHERQVNAIRGKIAPFLPEETLPKEEREVEAAQRLSDMRNVINVYNRDLDSAKESFLQHPLRAALKRKSAESVNLFHSKQQQARLSEAADLFSVLHSGSARPGSLKDLSTPGGQGSGPPAVKVE